MSNINSPKDINIPTCLMEAASGLGDCWQEIVRIAIRDLKWPKALMDIPHVSLSKTDCPIVILEQDVPASKNYFPAFMVSNTIRNLVFEVYGESAAAREKIYQCEKSLVYDGFKYSWFCLSLLSGFSFPKRTSYDSEKSEVSKDILAKHLLFWDIYMQFEHRFHTSYSIFSHNKITQEFRIKSWSVWGRAIFALCRNIGIDLPTIQVLRAKDPVNAAKEIKKYIGRESINGPAP